MKGNLPAECADCGEQCTYSKNHFQTHAEYLKKHRCPKCGNFALKTLSADL
jgi:predicted RNA-binding Zn-ribbon protein involved in translation (DUF1610 family)